jgi:hypothetical protein
MVWRSRVKTKDLFAGFSVTISPHDDVWLVSLHKDEQRTVTTRTYQELPVAVEAMHEWLLMLSDETEIIQDPAGADSELREALARAALGEEVRMSETIDHAQVRDEMRTWFEREMGKSRNEEK